MTEPGGRRPSVSLIRAAQDAVEWLRSLAADGPDLRVNAHKKAVHEAIEFAVEGDLEEAADVLICLLGALDHQGYDINDLAFDLDDTEPATARYQAPAMY